MKLVSTIVKAIKAKTVIAANTDSAELVKNSDVTLSSDFEGGDFDLFVAAGEERVLTNMDICDTIILLDTNKRSNRIDPASVGSLKSKGYKLIYHENHTVFTKNSDVIDAINDIGKSDAVKPVPFVGTTIPPEYLEVTDGFSPNLVKTYTKRETDES